MKVYKAITFVDENEWDYKFNIEVTVSAEDQLEKFLQNPTIKKVISTSYSVTKEPNNSYGIPQYKHHILLVYEEEKV